MAAASQLTLVLSVLSWIRQRHVYGFFFFNDTATTEIYTLSLHDALPILSRRTRWATSIWCGSSLMALASSVISRSKPGTKADRKSTRLNSSHGYISYAVFCLKKKKI